MRPLFLFIIVIVLPSAGALELIPPLSGDVVSDYGVRTDPFLGRPAMHTGLDFRASTGDSVVAAQNGRVTKAEWAKKGSPLDGLGNYVEICGDEGICTRYGHNSKLLVKPGDKVSAGQEIAEAGSTGRSTGPHAHFEVTKNGERVDPADYIKGFSVEAKDLRKQAEQNAQALKELNRKGCWQGTDEQFRKIKAYKIHTRSRYEYIAMPYNVAENGNTLTVDFLDDNYQKKTMTIKQTPGSDPIMKLNEKSNALEPKMKLTSGFGGVSYCGLAQELDENSQPTSIATAPVSQKTDASK